MILVCSAASRYIKSSHAARFIYRKFRMGGTFIVLLREWLRNILRAVVSAVTFKHPQIDFDESLYTLVNGQHKAICTLTIDENGNTLFLMPYMGLSA